LLKGLSILGSSEANNFANVVTGLQAAVEVVGITAAGLVVYKGISGVVKSGVVKNLWNRILGGAKPPVGYASSSLSGKALFEDLLFKEAETAFLKNGAMHPEIVNSSKLITAGEDIGNAAVVRELTKDGSNIGDWGKYTTKSINSPSGEFQVHFYYNPQTGGICTVFDYKAVFNHNGNW
jgi:hypothetical protein